MNPWWRYSRDLTLAGFEAQRVIGLRLMKLAAGGPAANAEARKMVTEKLAASAEAADTSAANGELPAAAAPNAPTQSLPKSRLCM